MAMEKTTILTAAFSKVALLMVFLMAMADSSCRMETTIKVRSSLEGRMGLGLIKLTHLPTKETSKTTSDMA